MVKCDAVIMSFLDGACVHIVQELQALAQKQVRVPPIFALVSKRTPNEMAIDLSAFDVTSTGRDIDGGSKVREGTRQRVLLETEQAIIRAKILKQCGWVRHPDDKGEMWLYKNVCDDAAADWTFDSKNGEKSQENGWRWFQYNDLNEAAKGLPRWELGPRLVEFLHQKEVV